MRDNTIHRGLLMVSPPVSGVVTPGRKAFHLSLPPEVNVALTKIHDIHPTPFTTRHDVALCWSGGLLRLAWLHYDVDRDMDGDLLSSYWIFNASQEPRWEPAEPLSHDARTGRR